MKKEDEVQDIKDGENRLKIEIKKMKFERENEVKRG